MGIFPFVYNLEFYLEKFFKKLIRAFHEILLHDAMMDSNDVKKKFS